MNHLVFGLLHCCREAQVLEAEKGTLEPSELNINSYYPVFPVLFQELPNSDENHHVTVILTHFLQIQRIVGKLFVPLQIHCNCNAGILQFQDYCFHLFSFILTVPQFTPPSDISFTINKTSCSLNQKHHLYLLASFDLWSHPFVLCIHLFFALSTS